ncbi:MAG: hypothetical protein Q8R15_02065 [Candidatus Micrarchaeota archaeon]|nr:hypothetical protein [Candidatus Micrarchaeota archaeon]
MILRPKTKVQIVGQLNALRAEQRRVIVFVGRHPNEGTNKIANRHHRDWEKHGAVTVRIPEHWTPHGFWKKIERKIAKGTLTDAQIKKLIRREEAKIPDDLELIKLLEGNKMHPPIINFHGTDSTHRHLEVRVHPYAPPWLHMAVKQALRKTRGEKPVGITFRPEYGSSGAEHPREILIDHRYLEKEGTKKQKRRLADRFSVGRSQLSREYLTNSRADAKDLAHFTENFSAKFERILRKLTEKELK